MTQIAVQPSSKALHRFMVSTAVMTLAVCGFATLFFWQFAHIRPQLAVTFIALTWVVVGLTWMIGSFLSSRRWHKTNYVFGDDFLTINKATSFGGVKQRMCRYDTMVSLHTDQTRAGKRHDYGTIRITMPRPEHDLVLPYVPEPERHAVFVKSQIAGRAVQSPQA